MSWPLIVIVGVQSAGKTTLAQTLAERLGYVVLPEVGEQCRKRAKCSVYESCEVFDEHVMLLELERDNEVFRTVRGQGVILEQWHLGNIAYARIRSPNVAARYMQEAKKVLQSKMRPLVIFLTLEPGRMVLRKPEGNESTANRRRLVRFYHAWLTELRTVLRDLEIETVEIDAEQDPEVISEIVERHVAMHTGVSSGSL